MSLRRREIPFMNFSFQLRLRIDCNRSCSRPFTRFRKVFENSSRTWEPKKSIRDYENTHSVWAGEFESSQRCGRIGEIMLVTRLPLLFLTNSSLHHHRRLVVDWQNQLKWQTFNFKIFSSFTSLVVCFAEEQWTWNSNYFRRRQTRNDLEKLFFPIRYIAEHELPPLDNPIGWWINGV